jgi:HTH-type transcriptional regulator/antitoxin HigA
MRITVDTIESERGYKRALAEIETLVDQDPRHGSAAAARLDVLGAIVAAYEQEHCPIAPPDPVDAILFHLNRLGEDESALIRVMGSRTRVWEILNRRRPLSLGMIRNLHASFGIPVTSLLGPVEPARRASL